jgi:hypothetical protein
MAENLLKVGSLGASLLGIAQSSRLHEKEVHRSEEFHKQSYDLEVEQHEKECMIERQKYLVSAYTSLEQHFQVRRCGFGGDEIPPYC